MSTSRSRKQAQPTPESEQEGGAPSDPMGGLDMAEFLKYFASSEAIPLGGLVARSSAERSIRAMVKDMLPRLSAYRIAREELASPTQIHVHVEASSVPGPTTDDRVRVPVDNDELNSLQLANQLLESRLSEARRAIARETRRYDQIEAEHHELSAQNSILINHINERSKVNDELMRALIARHDGHVRMFEKYNGVVKHVGKTTAVCLFEVDDDLVEQTYRREQFIDGRLPKKGDSLTVFVLAAEPPTEEHKDKQTGEGPEGIDEHATRPGKHVSGPLGL
ncbi:MAG: hypothetical protein JSU63_00490 [Phycisphaerales bacterium]|nr:MAG: hypothetical protein JSU63_00490 [Phycisphaerales bacterium]